MKVSVASRIKLNLATSVIALTVFGMATPALAQSAVQPDDQSGADVAAQTARDDDKAGDQEIVVTGSRIARRGTETTSPLQLIDSKDLDRRGFSTVAEALNELPSFGVPGASPVGFNQSGFGAGQSFVDFLGLGSQRTLTLVNGRRFVSSNTPSIFGPTGSGGSQVDLNIIPTKLIDRIETVAAIGAPIYGSDAIAGTINIILKHDYQGFDIDAQYGLSSRGDAPNYRVRVLTGKNFAGGRGNITIAGEFNDSKGLLFTDRDLTRSDDRFDRPATPGQFARVPYRDFRIPSVDPNGIPLVGGANVGLDFALSPQQSGAIIGDPTLNFGVLGANNSQLRFDPTGNLIPIDFGGVVGSPDGFNVFTSGGNGYSLRDVENLLTDLKRYSANVQGSFDLTPKIRLFGEGWYSFSQGRNLANQPAYNSALFDAAGTRDGSLIIPLSNPFLTAQQRAVIQNSIDNNPLSDQNNPFGDPALDGITQDYFYLGRANIDLSPGTSTASVENIRFVAGIEGRLNVFKDKEWRFEASFNFGRALTNSRSEELNEQNFRNALDSTIDANGNIVCRPGFTNSPVATLSATCVPFNPFGQRNSEAVQRYITTIATPRNLNRQYDALATISGPLVALPGGDLAFSLGYEHREESSSFSPGVFFFGSPDPDPTVDSNGDGDPTNDRGSYGRSTPVDPVSGKFVTNEIFGELNADIVSPSQGIPGIYSLSLQSAGRYVWNSVAGGDATYTGGIRYAPISLITFRGAYTRAIRAPSVTEAFNPTSSSFVFATDPCDSGEIVNGPDPTTRAANCAAAGVPANFISLSNQRSFPGFVFGNPSLQNERSDSFTVGAVITPKFVPGFSATVDYVDIKLQNAISQFSTDQVLAACYDSRDFPNNQFCSLVQRAANSQLSNVGTSYFNSSQLRYKGILADVSYRLNTPFLGASSQIITKVSYQYLDTLSQQVGANDAPTLISGGVGYSQHKGVLTAVYINGGFDYQVQASYVGRAQVDPNSPANFYSIPNVADVVFINMSASYTVNDRFTLRADVDNITDKGPPSPYPLAGGNTTYFRGILGRYIRVGAAVHF